MNKPTKRRCRYCSRACPKWLRTCGRWECVDRQSRERYARYNKSGRKRKVIA